MQPYSEGFGGDPGIPVCEESTRVSEIPFSVQFTDYFLSQAQVFTDVNGKVYMVKAKQPKGWQDEVIKPLNDFLDQWSAKYSEATRSQNATRASGHAAIAQRQPEQCPCVSIGYSHGNGSQISTLSISVFSVQNNQIFLHHYSPHVISGFSARVRRLIDEFKKNHFVKRYIGHISSKFCLSS